MRLPVILASLIPILALPACGDQKASASNVLDEPEAISDAATPRLFGHEKFTVVYSTVENPSVSKTEHIRNWGHRKSELLLGGSRIHMVYEDGRVWVSTSEVPGVFVKNDEVIAGLIAHIDDQPGLSIGHRRMLLSGLSPTGQTGEFAGHVCRYYRSPAEFSAGKIEACTTDWGALLYSKAEIPQVDPITIVASAVRIGDGGPDAAFDIDKANAQDADTF
jgi:hypothetical protein